MGGYLDTMLRYFEFSGRSSRSQYWLFQLFALLMIIAAVAFDMWRGVRPQPEYFGPVTLFVVIIHAVPQITVAVRRLHDVGRSGWWYLLNFVPFGALVLLVWACQASEEGTNEFGDGPSGAPREKRRPMQSGRPVRSADYARETLETIEGRRAEPRNRFTG